MIRNFFKVAFRNLIRNKGISAINITGLAVGMAAVILIFLWIEDEVSYDAFHDKKDRIYEVWNRAQVDGEVFCSNTVSEPTAAAIAKDLPEVERVVRVNQDNSFLLSFNDKKLISDGLAVDSGFLQIFSFPMLQGDPATALNGRHAVVLTQKTAARLFGREAPLGKVIKIEDKGNFTVTGILKDVPNNTRFEFEYLLPWSAIMEGRDRLDLGWSDNSTPTYVLLKPGTSFTAAEGKIKKLKQKYDEEAVMLKWELFLYPLERWRLYSSFTNGVEDGDGRIRFVKLLGIIAGFILLIACINFMNLSTARSEKRAREVGVRKVSGAGKGALVIQFVGESVLISLMAGASAIIIALLSLPAYNRFTEKQLFLNFRDIDTWLAFTGFIFITGLLAGSYPAFFLSSFRPVHVLKGAFRSPRAPITPRKVLVILQFTFAIVLIICTIIVHQQIDYARNREVGYNRDNVIYHFMTGDIPKNYELIKNELLDAGIAKSITKTNSPLTERWSNGWGQSWEGKDPNARVVFDRFLADDGIAGTVGLQFVKGRDFDLKRFPSDSTGLIINESALKVMKFKEPIGKIVGDLGVDWHIIGVVKDFILTSPYEPTRPLLLCGAKSSFMKFNVVQIKLNGDNPTERNLKQTEAVFRKYNPDYPFEYRFLDESYERKFDNEKRQSVLAALFAGLAILISCLGLFGLAVSMAENRVKEIGVRKVLGASVLGITALLSRDFIRLVGMAFILSAPVAYWAMSQWLMAYTYRIQISWWVFVFAGFLSIAIALLTVIYQSLRAALANPVKSLRTE